MRKIAAIVWLIASLQAGCAGRASTPASYLSAYGMAPAPRPVAFDICRSFGCGDTVGASLDGEEWEKVRRLFSPLPADAREERARAARAVGLLETLVGPKAGTQFDAPRNGFGPEGTAQLDCVAEASNATVYLLMLEDDGLLPRHRVGYPARRGFFLWFPHNSALLVERDTGGEWIVDSWYGPNGAAADVWPLALWRAGKENEGNRENR